MPWPRVLWACALVLSFFLSAAAAYRGGYVGPDYWMHLSRIRDPSRFFDYAQSSPPIYDFIGHGLYRLIGPKTAFPITLAIIQAAVNTVALWWFFLFSERRFRSPVLHLALVFFVTFLPVRMIHSVTSGADWLTVPVFVLLLYVFDRFLAEETSTPKNAAFLGLVLGLSIWSKYSFMAVLPAIFLIFAFLWWKRAWSLKKFVAICALSLVLPTALVLHSYWASARAKDAVAQTVWLPKGGAPGQPDMSWRELFGVKTADLQLFKAPEYFKKEILAAHKHSYLGLVHLGTFADTMNIFQDLPGSHSIDRILIPDLKTRRPWKTPVMAASVCLGALWTVLALVGTTWLFFGAVRRLWRDKIEREDAAVFMGIPYFLLLFLALPFVYSGALGGGWTPRLIIVPLLCFFWAGFLLLDRTVVAKWSKSAFVVLTLVVIQCGIEIVMLS
ncbi:MAG: glycosyltransferase family 39 protein [Chthoniobacterales bacterium]